MLQVQHIRAEGGKGEGAGECRVPCEKCTVPAVLREWEFVTKGSVI